MRRVGPLPSARPYGPSLYAGRSTPRVRVTFYTQAGVHSATQGTDPAVDLLAWSWSKQRASSSQPGQWSLAFSYRVGDDGETWATRLDAQDGVVIEAQGDIHDPWTTVVVGWVDQVAPNDTPPSQATITVSGSDMCKPLTKSNADFYANAHAVNTATPYAKAVANVAALSAPVAGSTIVATFFGGTQAPIVTQTDAWVQIALPEGTAWVPAASVSLLSVPDLYAATIRSIVRHYAQSAALGSSSVQGLTELIFQMTASKTKYPFTASADPPTLMVAALLLWTFQTFNVPWINGKQTLGLPDTLRFLLAKPGYGITATSAALSPFQGSVWSFFTSFDNEPLYELFLDTRAQAEVQGGHILPLGSVSQQSSMYDASDGASVAGGQLWGDDHAQAVLVWRRAPFDAPDWSNLVQNVLAPLEVGGRQPYKGDQDAYNLYFPYPDTGSTVSSALAAEVPPVLDAASAVRYGLNSLRVPIRGLASNYAADYLAMATDLWRWYRDNPTFWNNTITLNRGRPEIKVGQTALDQATGLSYYVEGVQHAWQVKQGMTTTLSVSRGAYRPSVMGVPA